MSRFVIKSPISADRQILRQKLLITGTDLTQAKPQEIAHSFEAIDIQMKAMCTEQQVNCVYHKETVDQCKSCGGKGRCYRCDREGHSAVIDIAQRETWSVRSAIKWGTLPQFIKPKCIKPGKPLISGSAKKG